MAQFRTTADIMDSVLQRGGEPTNGNSAYEARTLEFLNKIHHTVIAGGNEFDIEVNETWEWSKAARPMTIELQPKHSTGTVSLTNGSEAGTFSAAPTPSLAGWHISIDGRDGIFKLASHSAGATAFDLDGAYDGTTGATLNYKAFKLDYELVPEYIVIDSYNNKIDFEETADTELTSTLTAGAYTPSDLCTEIKTQLDSDGASTYTVTYSAITKKFTLASDLGGGGGTFKLLFQSGTNAELGAGQTLGFDLADQATASSHVSTYILGGISRLVEPFRIYKGASKEGKIYGMDAARFLRDYPLTRIEEGYPKKFTKIKERDDGSIWVRFNKYPEETTRIEIEWVPVPIDLKDNATSRPLIPRKYIDVLEYGASHYLLVEKEDNKSDYYYNLTKAKLNAMVGEARAQLYKTGQHFAQIIPRADLANDRRRLIYGEPENQ